MLWSFLSGVECRCEWCERGVGEGMFDRGGGVDEGTRSLGCIPR